MTFIAFCMIFFFKMIKCKCTFKIGSQHDLFTSWKCFLYPVLFVANVWLCIGTKYHQYSRCLSLYLDACSSTIITKLSRLEFFCMINKGYFKMVGDIFAFFNLLIFCVTFTLQSNILILDSLYLIITIQQIIAKQCKCSIFFFLLPFQNPFQQAILLMQLLWVC